MTKEQKEGLVKMTEDLKQKQIRLTKELAQVKALNSSTNATLKKTRDFSVGVPTDSSHKTSPSSADIPDVVSLPPKRRGKTENIPY